MHKTWFWPLGREDCLENEMATHFSILAWRIPWTEEPGRLQFVGLQKSQTWLSDWTTRKVCLLSVISSPTGTVVFHLYNPSAKHRECSVNVWWTALEREDNSSLVPFIFSYLKSLPAMQEAWVLPLGREDPLKKGMAIHSSILPWESPRQRSQAGCSLWRCKESDMTEWLTHSL